MTFTKKIMKNRALDKNKIRILAFVIGMLVALPLMSMLFNDDNNTNAASIGVVTADKLNVRTGAGTNYSIMTMDGNLVKLVKGTEVTIISESGDWYYVSSTYNDKEVKGYVSSEYITITKTVEDKVETTKKVKVTTDNLNVRTGAGTNYSILVSNGVNVIPIT